MVSSVVEALESGRQAARQREEDAYVKARRPIENAFSDRQSEQTIQRNDQVIANTDTQEARTAATHQRAEQTAANDDLYAAGALFNEAIARQLEADPNLKPSEVMARAPDAVKKRVGLDTPEAQAHFAEVYDKNPAQLRADAQMYGGSGRKVKSSDAATKDGVDGFFQTFEDGTTNFVPGYKKTPTSANPEPGAYTTPDGIRHAADGSVISTPDTGLMGQIAAAKGQGATVGKAAGEAAAADLPMSAAQARAAKATYDIGRAKSLNTSKEIDRALKQVDWTSAGVAANLKGVGGAPANLASTLNTIAANIGLKELLDLKAAGGTLGQVTTTEHAMLQGLLTGIEQNQDPAVLKEKLIELKTEVRNAWSRVEAAYRADLKARGPADMQGDSSAFDAKTQALLDKYK